MLSCIPVQCPGVPQAREESRLASTRRGRYTLMRSHVMTTLSASSLRLPFFLLHYPFSNYRNQRSRGFRRSLNEHNSDASATECSKRKAQHEPLMFPSFSHIHFRMAGSFPSLIIQSGHIRLHLVSAKATLINLWQLDMFLNGASCSSFFSCLRASKSNRFQSIMKQSSSTSGSRR